MRQPSFNPLGKALAFSSVVEVGTGLALLIAPAIVIALLKGGDVSSSWIPMGRCFGIALLALGLACWPERQRPKSSSPALRAMLTYNALIALYFAYLGTVGLWTGLLLWPGAALHGAVTLLLVWTWRDERRAGGGSGDWRSIRHESMQRMAVSRIDAFATGRGVDDCREEKMGLGNRPEATVPRLFPNLRITDIRVCGDEFLASIAFGLAFLVFVVAPAHAQSLEPRSYSNAPVGLNFLLAGYGYTEGSVAFDPSLPITNAHLHTNGTFLSYVRSLDAWGDSAKFSVLLPYIWLEGSALEAGRQKVRDVSGIADPTFRYAVDFYGAPALSAKDFDDYRQDLIVGASLQVSAPMGQYDDTRLVNIGTNRWSIKPELGISKALGPWTLELDSAVTFYTVNHDVFYGNEFAQYPLYSVQGHVIHNLSSGIWFALDSTHYTGGRTTVNGVKQDTWQSNTRVGLTVALPVNRNSSVKIFTSTGASSLSGGDFTDIGIAWQYRWGAGF